PEVEPPALIATTTQLCDARTKLGCRSVSEGPTGSPLSRLRYIQPATSPGVVSVAGNRDEAESDEDVAGLPMTNGMHRMLQRTLRALGFSCSSNRTISEIGMIEFNRAPAQVVPDTPGRMPVDGPVIPS